MKAVQRNWRIQKLRSVFGRRKEAVDLYFGPTAPAGKESNGTPTDPQAEFEILFRFYGPLPSLFDKSWVLPDVEPVK